MVALCFEPIVKEDAPSEYTYLKGLEMGLVTSDPNKVTCSECLEQMRHA
jgi:hypothetical protein